MQVQNMRENVIIVGHLKKLQEKLIFIWLDSLPCYLPTSYLFVLEGIKVLELPFSVIFPLASPSEQKSSKKYWDESTVIV